MGLKSLRFSLLLVMVPGSTLLGQVGGSQNSTPDSGLIAPQTSKPGFLSLFQTPVSDVDSIALIDSLDAISLKAITDSITQDSLSKSKSKFRGRNLPGISATPDIYYRTSVLNEEKKRIETAIGRYLEPISYSVSAKKIIGFTENFNVASNSLPGVLNVVKKQLPQIVSERKEITLDIDTSISQGDYSFFKNLINSVVNLGPEDIVDIKFWVFPNTAKERIAKRKNIPLPVKGNQAESDSTSTKDASSSEGGLMLSELLSRLDEEQRYDDSLKTNQPQLDAQEVTPEESSIPWFTIALGILVVILLVVLIIVMMKNSNQKPVKLEEEPLAVTNMGLKKIAEGAFEDNRPSLKKDEFKIHLLENPEAVAAFLSSTIEQNNDEALTIFAHLAKPSPDLVAMTKPFMAYNSFLTVLSRLDSPLDEKIDPQSIDKFLVTFNSAIKVLSKKEDGDVEIKGGKVFGFLEQLSDPQISSLLSRDKPEIASVVFAQLVKGRKLSVLNSLEVDFRNNLLIALSDIKKMPLSVIKEIGIRYSKKAREVAGLEDVNIDGLLALVETLDELDISKQIEIVDTMRANDLEKGDRLDKIFIGINGLVNISQDILRNALNDLETDVMIKSLFGLDEAILDHVLLARPPRERELIKAEIAALAGVSQSEQIEGRKRILNSVRKSVL